MTTLPTTPTECRAEQKRVLKQMADVLHLLLSGDEAMVQAVYVDIRRIYTDMAPAHAALLGAYAEALAIAEVARNLYANRLGWSDGRNPYAPRELWDELGRALGADPAGFCDPPDVCRNCNTPVARRSEMYTTEDGDLVCGDCVFDEADAQAPASAGGEG